MMSPAGEKNVVKFKQSGSPSAYARPPDKPTPLNTLDKIS